MKRRTKTQLVVVFHEHHHDYFKEYRTREVLSESPESGESQIAGALRMWSGCGHGSKWLVQAAN